MRLAKRLAAVARHVPPGAAVADIGTDHAYLPLYLVRKGIACRVIAGEVNPGPYEAARSAVRAGRVANRIDLRMGDGLQVVAPGEVDVVVVAGMGGRTITDILSAGRLVLARVRRLILQPMGDLAEVRRWLVDNGWRLADEEMVCEQGRYYVIIVAEPGREKVEDEFLLEVGPRLLEKRDATLQSYLRRRLNHINAVLAQMERARRPGWQEKRAGFALEAARIREVLENWQCRQRI